MTLHATLICLMLAALPLAALSAGEGVRRERLTLDVMTFNIRYGTANDGENRWAVRKPRTLELFRRHPATTIGLQEALAAQIDELTKELGYEALGVGRDDGKTKGEFSPILYDRTKLQALRSDTFWLSNTPSVPGSTHWGNTNVRICTWAFFRDRLTGRHFYHFNTHIDHESQPSRERSIALILQRIAERGTDDPVILTGDFNVGEANPVVATVKAAGFRDSFRALHPDEKVVGTFNGWKATFGTDKIDYIFVGPECKVTGATIVRDQFDGHWPSDHAPVVATLRYP